MDKECRDRGVHGSRHSNLRLPDLTGGEAGAGEDMNVGLVKIGQRAAEPRVDHQAEPGLVEFYSGLSSVKSAKGHSGLIFRSSGRGTKRTFTDRRLKAEAFEPRRTMACLFPAGHPRNAKQARAEIGVIDTIKIVE